MLYYLSQFLDMQLFGYITVRAGFAFMIAFVFTLFFMPRYIRWAQAKKANQPINKYVKAHETKRHTPTMGGAVFLAATLIATLISARLDNAYVWGGIITLLGFGLVGMKDDLGKILSGKNDEGLSAKGKMMLLAVIASLVTALLLYHSFPTEFYIPFYKKPLFDMSYFAIPFWVLVFLATTNAVNLTDGLDGLATVPSIIALFTLGAIAYVTGHAIFSQYLLIPNIKGVGEMSIMTAALAGGLMGFLWYNAYPAEVFMGDTGSLAIGGFLAYMAILTKSEILLVLIGIIFVIETLSVMLQVGSFKMRNGKRLFRMAPIHHHFELKGWPENKIIVRFWMIAFIANALALISFKFR